MNRPDETIDPLGLMPFRLIQPKKGYRCSMDPFLLCGFAGFSDERLIYDLGCGNGVISLLAATASTASRIVGIERQPQMVERARRSVELNAFGTRVSIVEEDIRKIEQAFPAGKQTWFCPTRHSELPRTVGFPAMMSVLPLVMSWQVVWKIFLRRRTISLRMAGGFAWCFFRRDQQNF